MPIALPDDVLQDALDYVQVSSATVKKAIDELSVHRQGQKAAASLRPAILEHMLEQQVIRPEEKEAAAAMLGSHPETLGLLKNAIDMIARYRGQTKAAGESGAAVDPKRAGVEPGPGDPGDYDSLKDPFVGRRTSVKKASDMALARILEPAR